MGTAAPSYVLDASVTAKWFTKHDESDRDKALALKRLHETGNCRLLVPEFSLLEVVNAIRYSSRSEERDAVRALDALEKIQLSVVSLDWDLVRRAVAVSWTHRLALYDAAYVALSERMAAPFVTADHVMFKKLENHPLVVRLADLDLR